MGAQANEKEKNPMSLPHFVPNHSWEEKLAAASFALDTPIPTEFLSEKSKELVTETLRYLMKIDYDTRCMA